MSENIINEDLNEELFDNQENEMEELSEVEVLTEQLKKEKEQYLRLFAEFDNFRKRTIKERLDIFKTASSEVITSLLPVLDDFERAIKEIEKSDDSEHLTGVQLIQTKLADTLRNKGLQPIEIEVGDDFNTDSMEAVTQIPAPSKDLKGKVVDVVETGYLLSDKVIRYAKVIVGN
ncbi:MAG: nucleotide exchange factor GrpE [Weeksellaceae bacterium]